MGAKEKTLSGLITDFQSYPRARRFSREIENFFFGARKKSFGENLRAPRVNLRSFDKAVAELSEAAAKLGKVVPGL